MQTKSPPRFVVDTSNQNTVLTKSKYSKLTKREKLQAFGEIACYGSANLEGFVFPDPSDKHNQKEAEAWLVNELSFLGKRDAQELRDIWIAAAENGDCSRLLFTAIKILQDKYKDV